MLVALRIMTRGMIMDRCTILPRVPGAATVFRWVV